jgi:hypothetical protein
MRDFRLVFLFAFGLLLFIATPFAASAQTTSDRIACVCGTVTAYTAAVPGTPGSLTIGGQTFAIADTTTIANADLIVVGTDVCLSATRDTTGALIGPATVIASTGGEPLSRPPLLSIPSTVTATQGSALTFTVAGTDALGGATSLTACGLPENATFDATTGQFSFTPAANQANQSFNVTFTVETCFGGSVSQSVTINVGPTSTQGAPFFNTPSGPITFNPGAATNFNVTASSPTAGCAVTVTASGLPEGATFDAATGAFSFTPTDAQLGQSFSAVFTATDCNNVTSTFALPIFVTAADGSTPWCHLLAGEEDPVQQHQGRNELRDRHDHGLQHGRSSAQHQHRESRDGHELPDRRNVGERHVARRGGANFDHRRIRADGEGHVVRHAHDRQQRCDAAVDRHQADGQGDEVVPFSDAGREGAATRVAAPSRRYFDAAAARLFVLSSSRNS